MDNTHFHIVEFTSSSTIRLADGTKVDGLVASGVTKVYASAEPKDDESIAREAFLNYLEGAALNDLFAEILIPYGSPPHYEVRYQVEAAIAPDVNQSAESTRKVRFALTKQV